MFGLPSAWNEILGFPPSYVVLGLAIVGFAVGIAWLRRITRGPDDSNITGGTGDSPLIGGQPVRADWGATGA
jgi:hypothetical protein